MQNVNSFLGFRFFYDYLSVGGDVVHNRLIDACSIFEIIWMLFILHCYFIHDTTTPHLLNSMYVHVAGRVERNADTGGKPTCPRPPQVDTYTKPTHYPTWLSPSLWPERFSHCNCSQHPIVNLRLFSTSPTIFINFKTLLPRAVTTFNEPFNVTKGGRGWLRKCPIFHKFGDQ